MSNKQKVYMVCDEIYDEKAKRDDAPHVGIENLGWCFGRILTKDGEEIGRHTSSTLGWLRKDLKNKLDDPSDYIIVDLINEETPEEA